MDDDEWQEMPVVREGDAAFSSEGSSADEGAKKPGASGSKKKGRSARQYTVAQEYKRGGIPASTSSTFSSPQSPYKSRQTTGNATGRALDIQDARGYNWRTKPAGLGAGFGSPSKKTEGKIAKEKTKGRRRLGEGENGTSSSSSSDDEEDEENDGDASKGYTQLRLEDDPEQENLNAATDYLFTGAAGGGTGGIEEINATPQSQLHTTKNLLSEGQKIAYVGLVSLMAKAMVRALERVPSKEYKPAVANADEWRLRVMARLYQHMDIDAGEQSMIESLAEHGVLAQDLAPSLIMTQTIDNPDYDPAAAAEREEEERERQEELAEQKQMEEEERAMTEAIPARRREEDAQEPAKADTSKSKRGTSEDAGAYTIDDNAEDEGGDLSHSGEDQAIEISTAPDSKSESPAISEPQRSSSDGEQDDGDIGRALEAAPPAYEKQKSASGSDTGKAEESNLAELEKPRLDPNTAAQIDPGDNTKVTPLGLTSQSQAIETLPSALEGVTTELSSADKTITLDLRWTVLCDLFLVLTADSVYDARSRVLLESIAEDLGLSWMDVTKFEKRVTDALEIEEGVAGTLKGKKAIRKRAEMVRRRRMVMMGLATIGGGLVIGLSAGLMAPLIGAGLGAALGTVGIGGTSAFLTGVGGITVITGTGTIGGAALAGTGMSRRTRQVRVFEFKPIHNNKRVNCIITVPGFMNSAQDDPRLPFSVLDSIMGDIFALLWEPDMMAEMGNAIHLLWTETMVQGVQQVLAATIAGGLVGALAWPLWLTKLGWFIDNPWSNALDRAQACGLILADVLSKRKLGVRPVTLVGFSLGARVIFYALVELARTKKFGVVQNVYIMGAPVTANDKTWQAARSVVAGRFVNAFSRSDWILGWLFRATTGGLRSIAGLRPVERVPDVENIDVTRTVPGHLQYRAFMPLVLDQMGFKTTADYFDEPEDLADIPEREMVYDYDEPEMQLKTVKTKTGGFGKIFKRLAPGQEAANKSGSNSASVAGSSVDDMSRRGSVAIDDDDDLPPREDAVHSPLPVAQADEQDKPQMSPTTSEKRNSKSMSADDEMAQILAELRESGIEVRELQSSLPPLVASPQLAQAGLKSLPRTPSALKAEIQPDGDLPGRPSTPPNDPFADTSAVDETPRPADKETFSRDYFPDQQPRSRYHNDISFKDLPSSAPPVNEGGDVALSFGDSYDDDAVGSSSKSGQEDFGDFGEAQQRYGLSPEAARQLAKQFESSGMSSSGAAAAARLAHNLETLEGSDMDVASSLAASNQDKTTGWASGLDPWGPASESTPTTELAPMAMAARKHSGSGDSGMSMAAASHHMSRDGSASSAFGEDGANGGFARPDVPKPQSTHAWVSDNPWG